MMRDMETNTGGAGGIWLATGAGLLAAALIFHGPPDSDLTVQMQHVAEGHSRWTIVHWTAAISLFLLSGAAFLNLTTNSRVQRSALQSSAWTVMALGALVTITTAVSEAAVVSVAARTGDTSAFMTWWAFSSGMANGFWALALATTLIAYSDSQDENRRLPRGVALAGAAFGVLSALGWTLGQQLGIGIGGPIWLVSSLLMCIWLVAFGLAFAGLLSGPVSARRASKP